MSGGTLFLLTLTIPFAFFFVVSIVNTVVPALVQGVRNSSMSQPSWLTGPTVLIGGTVALVVITALLMAPVGLTQWFFSQSVLTLFLMLLGSVLLVSVIKHKKTTVAVVGALLLFLAPAISGVVERVNGSTSTTVPSVSHLAAVRSVPTLPADVPRSIVVPGCKADVSDKSGWSKPLLTYGDDWAVTPAWSRIHLKQQIVQDGVWQDQTKAGMASSLVRYCTRSEPNAGLSMPLIWKPVKS